MVLRRDSITHEAGGVSLGEVRLLSLDYRPTFADRLKVAGVMAAVGAGLAVFPATSRDSFGEAAESAAIGAAVGFGLGIPIGGRKHREWFIVEGVYQSESAAW
ncbi:MAG: hypothetical protein Rubg2KO_34780 [Rubricoccaceae bacterium]